MSFSDNVSIGESDNIVAKVRNRLWRLWGISSTKHRLANKIVRFDFEPIEVHAIFHSLSSNKYLFSPL